MSKPLILSLIDSGALTNGKAPQHRAPLLFRLCGNGHKFEAKEQGERFVCPICGQLGGRQYASEADRQDYLEGRSVDRSWYTKGT